MLIRFSVENFLSFKDEVEFSMVAGRTRKHKDHIITSGKRNDIRLLKTGVIYGANASGKSNLIKAMAFAKDLIVRGTRAKQTIPVIPYRFDSSTKNKHSKWQFEFKCNPSAYIYGFELDKTQIYSEWLYEIRPASEKMLFERETDLDGRTKIKFGNISLTAEQDQMFLDFTAKGTRPNQLFLTESMERNIKYFENIYNWFDDSLVLIFPDTTPAGIEIAFMSDQDFQKQFRNLIKLFDLGIHDIRLEDFDFDTETRLPNEIKERIKQDIREMNQESAERSVIQIPQLNILVFEDENNRIVSKKFMTSHQVDGKDELESLELAEESDGTQRLFEIIPALLDLLSPEHERVFVIDELDRRLHSLLSYKILELFLTRSKNQRSQLIVTTHEVGILDLNLLRRDEIWFIEKDAKGASSVYSLEEFLPRYDKDIRKSYSQGRFGAIPLLPSRHSLELQT